MLFPWVLLLYCGVARFLDVQVLFLFRSADWRRKPMPWPASRNENLLSLSFLSIHLVYLSDFTIIYFNIWSHRLIDQREADILSVSSVTSLSWGQVSNTDQSTLPAFPVKRHSGLSPIWSRNFSQSKMETKGVNKDDTAYQWIHPPIEAKISLNFMSISITVWSLSIA